MSYKLHPSRSDYVWDSDADSDSAQPTIAAATSKGIYYLKMTTTGTYDSDETKTTSKSDVLAVRWLSPKLLLGGCRNGNVLLYDQRVEKDVQALYHPSGVVRLRVVDEHRVVVAGMEDQLHTYDLRYLSTVPAEPRPLRPANIRRTVPYISYSAYRNSSYCFLGFDASSSLGLIAAATEDKKIKMLELWTGKEIVPAWGIEKVWEEQVQCLLFVHSNDPATFNSVEETKTKTRNGDTGLCKRLLIASGDSVVEWGW